VFFSRGNQFSVTAGFHEWILALDALDNQLYALTRSKKVLVFEAMNLISTVELKVFHSGDC